MRTPDTSRKDVENLVLLECASGDQKVVRDLSEGALSDRARSERRADNTQVVVPLASNFLKVSVPT